MNDANWYDFEDLDWDDEEDEEGNFQHCLGADHLGEDPKRVVDELLAEEPIRSKLRLETAEFALVGPNAARDTLWTVAFAASFKRGDWLRPITGGRRSRNRFGSGNEQPASRGGDDGER